MEFSGAEDDEVKGLTFAKRPITLLLFFFTDYLHCLAYFPFMVSSTLLGYNDYQTHPSLFAIYLAIVIHVDWLGILIFQYAKRESKNYLYEIEHVKYVKH